MTTIPSNASNIFDEDTTWTQEDVELALRFQTDKVPEWVKTALQEAARIDLHPHQLLHLAADCDILGALIAQERYLIAIEAWVQSDIPDWMRSALVEFRIAEDRWGRYRIAAIPPVLIKLIGTYYKTQNQGERSQ